MKKLIITSALKTTQDGIRIFEIGVEYEVHLDPSIGEFIIGSRGVHGLITMKHLEFYRTYEPYMINFEVTE